MLAPPASISEQIVDLNVAPPPWFTLLMHFSPSCNWRCWEWDLKSIRSEVKRAMRHCHTDKVKYLTTGSQIANAELWTQELVQILAYLDSALQNPMFWAQVVNESKMKHDLFSETSHATTTTTTMTLHNPTTGSIEASLLKPFIQDALAKLQNVFRDFDLRTTEYLEQKRQRDQEHHDKCLRMIEDCQKRIQEAAIKSQAQDKKRRRRKSRLMPRSKWWKRKKAALVQSPSPVGSSTNPILSEVIHATSH